MKLIGSQWKKKKCLKKRVIESCKFLDFWHFWNTTMENKPFNYYPISINLQAKKMAYSAHQLTT